jgi:hypothetical protein
MASYHSWLEKKRRKSVALRKCGTVYELIRNGWPMDIHKMIADLQTEREGISDVVKVEVVNRLLRVTQSAQPTSHPASVEPSRH